MPAGEDLPLVSRLRRCRRSRKTLGAGARICLWRSDHQSARVAMRSAATCGRRSLRDFRVTTSIAGFQSNRSVCPTNPPMPNLRSDRRPDHWFFDGWRSVRDQLEAAGVPPDHTFSAELCTASHPQCLVFLSTRRHADGPHGSRDQVPAAPSIAALASRSACLLASRRTCSNDTRPISRASSRAFAWSGCSPGCFTL